MSSWPSSAYLNILLDITICFTGMLAVKRYRTRSSGRATHSHTSQGEIHRFFQSMYRTSPGAIVAAPRDSGLGSQLIPNPPASPGFSSVSDSLPETPALFCLVMSGVTISPLHWEMRHLDGDIQALLQALPTKQEIEALILSVEETHHQDIQAVHSPLEREDTGESSLSSLKCCVRYPPSNAAWWPWSAPMVDLQLTFEDQEDTSRRNNL